MDDTGSPAMRAAMVATQLRVSAVSDPLVLAAMGTVAREAFVPEGRRALAYNDRPVPLGRRRALNPPLATGLLLDALQVLAGERVLLIGAATGYAAALLAAMGAQVVALEEDAALLAHARAALADASAVTLVEGPLVAGWPAAGPYDALIVDGAIEQLPDAFAAQLADGGRIATGLVERGVTRLARGRKAGGVLGLAGFADIETVVLPGFAVRRGFTF